MAFFNEFPNTRTYDNDLGWLIHVVGQLQNEVQTFIENNTINIPDQITWDITKQYTRNTLVIDYDGTAYLSKQPVPVGIAITNTDYWMPIFNYDDSINTLRANIATNERNHTTASAERHAGELVWLGNALYKVTADMPAGTAYIAGTNVELYTVEDYLLFLKGAIASEAQARESADTTLQGHIDAVQENLDAEVLARQGADNTLQGNIDAEALARQGADNTLQGNIDAITTQIPELKNSYYDMAAHGADKTGAVACDSILEAAIASGKAIYFPAGTYLFNSQHVFQNVRVYGDKAVLHTSSFGLNGGAMNSHGGFNSRYDQMLFRLSGNVDFSGFVFDDIDAGGLVIDGSDCHVHDCKISTLATISGSTGYYAIVVRGCDNIAIDTVEIAMEDGNNRDGIHIEGNTHNVYISNCNIIGGDDGLALNALEGVGGNIYNIFVNNCYIGGYGVRFFGNGDTQVYHVEISNCTIEVTSPSMQSGCIRFSNSTNTIGGTPIGTDGFFNNINIVNCNLIGNANTNLSIYCFHAYVACRLTNCVLYNVVYYDASTKDTHIHFSNCLLNDAINVTSATFFTSIELCECDIHSVTKSGSGTLILTATDVNILTALSISGSGGDQVKFINCYIIPASPTLTTSNATFTIKNTRVEPSFSIIAGAANYFIDGLIGHGGGDVITNGGAALRISGDIMVDALPSTPVNTDHVIVENLYKWYLSGNWLNVNMSA